jgi:uncharacterized protein
MIVLLAMGLICHSFYNLEIISVYAFFGILLIPLYKVKNWILIVIFLFLILGGPRTIRAIQHNSKTAIEQVNNVDEENIEEQADLTQRPRDIPEHIKNPSFINSARHNYKVRLARKLNYQFGYIGRGYITLALFVLGFVIGRLRFFEKLEEFKKRNIKLFIGFLLATLVIILINNELPPVNIFMLFNPDGQYISNSLLTVLALGDIGMVLSSAALTLGFILLYQKKEFKKYLEVLSPYGRTGLTNYIMQGVIGSLIFSLWAFGSTFGGWGTTALFVFGIIIYVAQGLISKYWLKYCLYGPLEWLWRTITYLQVQPFVKKLK